MRALALAVALVALPAFSEPSDAPVRILLKAGQPAPSDGAFFNSYALKQTAQEVQQLRGENAELRSRAAELPTAVLFATFAAGVLAGGAAVFVLSR